MTSFEDHESDQRNTRIRCRDSLRRFERLCKRLTDVGTALVIAMAVLICRTAHLLG